MMRKLTVAEAERWVEALLSGNFPQGMDVLKKEDSGVQGGFSYCCLGVLCEILEYNSVHRGIIKHEVKGHSHIVANADLLDDEIQSELAQMNDEGKSFDYLAGYISGKILPKLRLEQYGTEDLTDLDD